MIAVGPHHRTAAERESEVVLNPKQQRFVAEYLVDLNATQAAIRAGYSAHTAESQGSRLLRKDKVQEAIRAGRERIAKRIEVTQERVLQELARLAFGDIRKLFASDGRMLRPHELDDDTAAMLAGVEVKMVAAGDDMVDELRKVRAWDKARALELLARHLGMLNDKLELKLNEGIGERLERARARVRAAKRGDAAA